MITRFIYRTCRCNCVTISRLNTPIEIITYPNVDVFQVFLF